MPKPTFTQVLAVDFDGVLHDYKHPVEGKRMGNPLPGALNAMDTLYDKRIQLVIHTTKARTESGQQAVEDWLDFYGFEYDHVTALKPNADFYIDDRAIHHTSWPETMGLLGYSEELDG